MNGITGFTSDEDKLLTLVRKAVGYNSNGDPIKDVMDESEVADSLELLIKLTEMLKGIDTLTVSKLRPISELPIVPKGKFSVNVLVFFENSTYPSVRRISLGGSFEKDVLKCGLGWLHVPIYKPDENK